ncbi:nuclear transport factor 2 family protein [Microbacterium sp.]|uniref:nuclear transport factor 2 family protein n=1 Tax=Microbacterium sp. TaxID=51671 RepID=UPI003A8E6E0F
MTDSERAARAVIDAIIDDYAHHRRDAYFSRFADDASFVFHTSESRLESRAEYEALWKSWEDDHDFHVISCTSSKRRLQMFDSVGVFSHEVDTTLTMDGARDQFTERETIVVALIDGQWRGIHEHLSGIDVPEN